MSLTNMTREEMQAILTQLEQAYDNHVKWHNGLIRTLTCRLQGDLHDTKQKAHRECLFGQWYYHNAPKKLLDHPGFIAVGEAHKYMHELATQLLLTARVGNLIDSHDYDSFANAIERMRLEITSLKHEVEISLYTHDPLTGAVNRADMLPSLRELHGMVQREAQTCSIVMMDLDFFKGINDEFGHPAGDKVLVSIARYISDNLRSYDKLFRYGGEEFLICMQQTGIEECYRRVEDLRKGIAHIPLKVGSEDPQYITASFGITALDPVSSVEQCIDRADKALYTAKSAGRNCTRIVRSPINKKNISDVHSIP